MSKEIYSTLYDYCRWNRSERFEKLLENCNEKIDLTYDNGLFFQISVTEENSKMLSTLLQYYEKTQLQGDSNSLEYKVAKHKLQTVLQDAINSFDVSKEMQAVLDKYLPKEEDSDQELDDLDDIQLPYFSNNSASPELTEDNLKRLDEHHNQGLELVGKDHQILDTY